MSHLECSHDGRRITLPLTILRSYPPTDLSSAHGIALLDTGATTSAISPRIVNQLGLVSVGKRVIALAQGEAQVDRYVFRVGLHSGQNPSGSTALPFIFEPVLGFELQGGIRFDALLGMDVLSQCEFRMDRNRRAILTFG